MSTQIELAGFASLLWETQVCKLCSVPCTYLFIGKAKATACNENVVLCSLTVQHSKMAVLTRGLHIECRVWQNIIVLKTLYFNPLPSSIAKWQFRREGCMIECRVWQNIVVTLSKYRNNFTEVVTDGWLQHLCEGEVLCTSTQAETYSNSGLSLRYCQSKNFCKSRASSCRLSFLFSTDQ